MDDKLTERYITLLRDCLTRSIVIDEEPHPVSSSGALDVHALGVIAASGWEVVRIGGDRLERSEGRDWPPHAETMVGTKRLDNLWSVVETVLADDIPGDLIETGAWRGGATILMRGILAAHGVVDRVVWVADSFEGLPPPDTEGFPADEGVDLSGVEILKVDADTVRANFARYGLLDDQVRFLEGWFRETLPAAPIDTLAVIRLDGDLYESTITALDALYPKLSPGGFVIVDDYGAFEPCRQAVHDYRDGMGISDEIVPIDWTGVFFGAAVPMADLDDYFEALTRAHEFLRPSTYLEIGVHKGHSLRLATTAQVVIGVDPEPAIEFELPDSARVVARTSDDFFDTEAATLLGAIGIDLAFIDGLHHWEQTLRDFANTERFADDGAVVLIHDCLPIDAETSTRERRTLLWSGDVWKTVVWLRRHRRDLNVATLDVGPTGLAVVTGLNPHTPMSIDLEFDRDLQDLGYDDVSDSLDDLLNVVPGTSENLHAALRN